MMESRELGRWEVGKQMGSREEDGKREEGRDVDYLTRPGPKARRKKINKYIYIYIYVYTYMCMYNSFPFLSFP